MKPTIRLNAKLEKDYLILPKSAGVKVSNKEKVTIEGIINSLPFRANLEPVKGNFRLRLNKSMQKAAERSAGENITVEITRIGDEVETRIPIDFRKALAASPRAKSVWEDITPLMRRDWIFWAISGKQQETRVLRIKKACDMLSSGKRRVCCFGGVTWLMKKG